MEGKGKADKGKRRNSRERQKERTRKRENKHTQKKQREGRREGKCGKKGKRQSCLFRTQMEKGRNSDWKRKEDLFA